MSQFCYSKFMSRLLKSVFISLILLLGSLLVPSLASATPQEFIKAVQEGNNLQWYLGGQQGMMSTTIDSLTISIIGARDDQGQLISAGAIQGTSTLMATLYKKPASSVDYVAYLINHSGLAKPTYAQGQGWDFLTNTKANLAPRSVILEFWQLSRNVVYLFFVVIFVAIGFMIMFRSKLNPQTVINIQLAIPSIVVSLILVTFSYAICGFIIDFVYLGHNLIGMIYFFSNSSPLYTLITTPTGMTTPQAYVDIVSKVDIVSALFAPTSATTPVSTGWGDINVFDQFAKFILNIGGTIADILGGNISGLIPLILAFSLLGTGLKIFFGLLTKYVTLILSTIFSPFVFLLSAFPGKSEGIGTFFKTMLSAALTFPATAFIFFLSSFFVSKTLGVDLNGLPPLNEFGILEPGKGTFGTQNVLEPLIGLGILMAATQVPQAIDQALGAKPGIAGAATPDISSALSKIPIIGGMLH